MSCDQLWSRESSICTDSSDTCRKRSLVDVISGTIDLAVGRANSQLDSRGLNSVLHWSSKPGVVTRTLTGRPMSLTYDDIISRSLMANCKKPVLNKVRKHKANEFGAYAIYDVVSRSLVDPNATPKSLKEEGALDGSKDLNASSCLSDCNDASKSLKEDKTLDEYNDLINRILLSDCKDTSKSLKENKKRLKSVKDDKVLDEYKDLTNMIFLSDCNDSSKSLKEDKTLDEYNDLINRIFLSDWKNISKSLKEDKTLDGYKDLTNKNVFENKYIPKSLKNDKTLDGSKYLINSTFFDNKDTPKSLKDDKTLDGSKDLTNMTFIDDKDTPNTLKGYNGTDYIRNLTGSQKPEVLKVSRAVEKPAADYTLKATAELISIPDFMQASTSSHNVPKLRTRKSVTCSVKTKPSRCLKATSSRVTKAVQRGNRMWGGVDTKTTPTEVDVKELYMSLTPTSQPSGESLEFGDSTDEASVTFSEVPDESECDAFTEQFFEMSTEEWNNPERMFAVMQQWRDQQLRETRSQAPLVERASKYFRGRTFSRNDLREFLRRSYSEQMDRLKNAFQGLLVIQEFLDKVNSKDNIDFHELTKELQASK